MGIVAFDPATFVARYPEFQGVTNPLLGMYFDEATMYLNNTDASRVVDIRQRAVLLNMLTAHIAALNGSGSNGNGAPAVVGRINSASEGSVSVTTEYAAPANGTQAWYQQTQYGVAYWAASARYRTMQYVGRC